MSAHDVFFVQSPSIGESPGYIWVQPRKVFMEGPPFEAKGVYFTKRLSASVSKKLAARGTSRLEESFAAVKCGGA